MAELNPDVLEADRGEGVRAELELQLPVEGAQQDERQLLNEAIVNKEAVEGPQLENNQGEGAEGNDQADGEENGEENVPIEPGLPQLPAVVQVLIAEHIQGYQNLMNARLVSSSFKRGATRALQRTSSTWKPEFLDWSEFVQRTKGTRLKTEDQVLRFLRENRDRPTSPFVNGTLIWSPRNHRHLPDELVPMYERNALTSFYNLFTTIVALFGHHIFNLVYCFKSNNVVNIMQICGELGCILSLRNLRSLAVYRPETLKNGEIYDFDEQMFLEPASEFALPMSAMTTVRELQIFGSSDNEDEIGVQSCIRSLCASVAPSCERLSFQFSDSSFICQDQFRPVLSQIPFPLLRKLRLVGRLTLDDQRLIFENGFFPRTVEDVGVSLYFEDFHEHNDDQILANLFEGLGGLQLNNLTSFTLHHNNAAIDGAGNIDIDALPVNPYPLVTNLRIKQVSMERWPNMLEAMNRKFPNIRILTIDVDARSNFTPIEYKNQCVGMFRNLPNQLEVIRVPYFLYLVKRDGSGEFYEED